MVKNNNGKNIGIVGGLAKSTVVLCAFGAISLGSAFGGLVGAEVKGPQINVAGAITKIINVENSKKVEALRQEAKDEVSKKIEKVPVQKTSDAVIGEPLFSTTSNTTSTSYIDKVVFNYKQGLKESTLNKPKEEEAGASSVTVSSQEELSNELWRQVSRGVLVEKVFESIHARATFSVEERQSEKIIENREEFLKQIGKEISSSKEHKDVFSIIDSALKRVKSDKKLGFGSEVLSGSVGEHERFVNNFEQQMRFLLSEDQKLDSSGIYFDGRSGWLTDVEFEKVEALEKELFSKKELSNVEVNVLAMVEANAFSMMKEAGGLKFSEENEALAKKIMKNYGFSQINIDSAKNMNDIEVKLLLEKTQEQMARLEKAMNLPASQSVGFDGKYQLHLSNDGTLKDFGRQAYVNAQKSIFVINQGSNSVATLGHEWVHMLDGASGQMALNVLKNSVHWDEISPQVKENWDNTGVFFSEMPEVLRGESPKINEGFEQWWGAMQNLPQGWQKAQVPEGSDFGGEASAVGVKLSQLEVKASGGKLKINESNEFIKASMMLDERSKSSGMSNYWLRPTEMLARSIERQVALDAGEEFAEQKGKYAQGVAPKLNEEQAQKLKDSIGLMLNALGYGLKDEVKIVKKPSIKEQGAQGWAFNEDGGVYNVGGGATNMQNYTSNDIGDVFIKESGSGGGKEARIEEESLTKGSLNENAVKLKTQGEVEAVESSSEKTVNAEIKIETLKGRLRVFGASVKNENSSVVGIMTRQPGIKP